MNVLHLKPSNLDFCLVYEVKCRFRLMRITHRCSEEGLEDRAEAKKMAMWYHYSLPQLDINLKTQWYLPQFHTECFA